jgi:hypothetical protein
VLATDGYRILETEHVLHVQCQACPEGDRWSLATNGNRAVSAEFDDRPYQSLLGT